MTDTTDYAATRLTDPAVFARPDNEPLGSEPAFRTDAPMSGHFLLHRDAMSRPLVTLKFGDGGEATQLKRRWALHSPTGLEWGYGGSGPADLALEILGFFLPPWDAWYWHQDFKWQWLASLPTEGARLEVRDIRMWIEARHAEDLEQRQREEAPDAPLTEEAS